MVEVWVLDDNGLIVGILVLEETLGRFAAGQHRCRTGRQGKGAAVRC